jgi:hypothetical protein
VAMAELRSNPLTRHSPRVIAIAMTLAASTTAAQPQVAPPQQVTVIGCVTRNGAVEHDKGTRELQTVDNGLVLSDARITVTGRGRASAVPGSLPSGTDSGTIPQRGSVVGRTPTPNPTNTGGFTLVGKIGRIDDFVGRRVEVTGIIRETSNPAGETAQPRGVTGSDRPESVVTDSGTREERPAEASSHPSADLQRLEVISFRGATGACR